MLVVNISPTPVLSGTVPFTVELDFTVVDDNPNAATGTVIGRMSWGDGLQDSVNCVRTGTFKVTHTYVQSGLYLLELLVHDLAYPTNTQSRTVFQVTILPATIAPSIPDPILIGPVIPLDNGDVVLNEWDLDISTDEKVIASDLKILLTTQKGERLMDPTYGTNLKLIVFDPINGVQDSIEDEILRAVALYEPRVVIEGISVVTSGLQAVVKVSFKPYLSGRSLTIAIPFTQ